MVLSAEISMIGTTISHYKILAKIGEGGMGVVYKAHDTKLDRDVALKFLPSELTFDPKAKERFIHEAQAASALEHPNICNIHEIGETNNGQLFIVMACYDGMTLKKKIERGPLPIDEAVGIAAQIAAGLGKAHDSGIVHRDIKPANVVVTKDGTAKILDFGLAKLSGRTLLTKTGTTVGTAAYMSPEQSTGDKVDHRTDIWSLGVVLYEMVTGHLPFSGDHEPALLYSIVHEEPKPFSSVRSNLPPEIELSITKMLQKEPGERFQHIRELLSQLGTMKKKHETDSENILPSIAVLPFLNMSPDPENDYFSDGLSEEIINALSKLEGLHVTARTSAFRFRGKDLDVRDIGRQLNVITVLEGSVRKAANTLRITAQLINVEDGYHLWSEKYDRELKDIFVIQDEISLAIVEKLKVRLLGEDKARLSKRYTDDFEAYDLYLKGRYYLNTVTEEGVRKSLVCFQQAIQKDPRCALAYVGMAGAFAVPALIGLVPSPEVMPRVKIELLKALELDDSLAEAHAWLGEYYLQYEWNWSSAEHEFKRAIELKPNSAEAHQFYADYLTVTGSMDNASAEAERARDLDPLSSIPNTIFAYQLFVSGRFDQTIEHCRTILKTEPNFLLQVHLWRALRGKNMLDEAFVECKNLFTLFANREVAEAMEFGYAESGYKGAMRMGAQKLVEQSTARFVSPYMIATLFAHAEDGDGALQWLEKACEERDQIFYSMSVDPDWDSVRSNPRFRVLLKKLGRT
jgi:serine/threonine protein kinase/tetratricopeptide (TPR) repeat protein